MAVSTLTRGSCKSINTILCLSSSIGTVIFFIKGYGPKRMRPASDANRLVSVYEAMNTQRCLDHA